MSRRAVPLPNASDALTVPPGAVDRFRADLDTLRRRATGAAPRGGVVALAVSGGPDSMAILALAAVAMPGGVIAATFDHQLRPESAGEAAMVAAACARIGVRHATLLPHEPITGSSTQMRARTARYRALTAWVEREGAHALLTAHHADDQAETLLMRLNRASGIAGLAGIRPYRHDGATLILRPLLGWRRAELRAIATGSGLPFVDDPSNHDERYDRVGVRALLAERSDLDPVALAASAGFLIEVEDVIARLAEATWAERWDADASGIALDDLSRELRRRLVRRAIAEVRGAEGVTTPAFSDGANVESLLDAMEAGRGATQAGVQARRARDRWNFRLAPPRRSP